jgi:hypothetical protein
MGITVEVYRNLHKNKWSIRHKGRIIKHLDSLVLLNCVFRVQPAGRKKVLREKRKNVHAYIKGELNEFCSLDLCTIDASYNPYKFDYFFRKRDNSRIDKCSMVTFLQNGSIKIND